MESAARISSAEPEAASRGSRPEVVGLAPSNLRLGRGRTGKPVPCGRACGGEGGRSVGRSGLAELEFGAPRAPAPHRGLARACWWARRAWAGRPSHRLWRGRWCAGGRCRPDMGKMPMPLFLPSLQNVVLATNAKHHPRQTPSLLPPHPLLSLLRVTSVPPWLSAALRASVSLSPSRMIAFPPARQLAPAPPTPSPPACPTRPRRGGRCRSAWRRGAPPSCRARRRASAGSAPSPCGAAGPRACGRPPRGRSGRGRRLAAGRRSGRRRAPAGCCGRCPGWRP